MSRANRKPKMQDTVPLGTGRPLSRPPSVRTPSSPPLPPAPAPAPARKEVATGQSDKLKMKALPPLPTSSRLTTAVAPAPETLRVKDLDVSEEQQAAIEGARYVAVRGRGQLWRLYASTKFADQD